MSSKGPSGQPTACAVTEMLRSARRELEAAKWAVSEALQRQTRAETALARAKNDLDAFTDPKEP
jgi:hypothetical protein